MRHRGLMLGLVLGLLCYGGTGQSQPPCPAINWYPVAPDACGPGFYAWNHCGCPYGPNYYLLPPWEPFNGLRPSPAAAGSALPGMPSPLAGLPPITSLPPLAGARSPLVTFPTHPFARSPRDFFMWTEVTKDAAARQRLPILLP